MRPNLSVEKIAGALAVVGTSMMIAACGGEEKPAQSPDAIKATETSAPVSDKKADDPGKAADAKPADTSAPEATPAAAAAPAAPDTKAAAATTPDAKAATTTTPTKTDAKKPAAAAPAPAKKGGGNSCGAGTCGGGKK